MSVHGVRLSDPGQSWQMLHCDWTSLYLRVELSKGYVLIPSPNLNSAFLCAGGNFAWNCLMTEATSIKFYAKKPIFAYEVSLLVFTHTQAFHLFLLLFMNKC